MKKSGATPGKLALVAVLAVVLVGVLTVQVQNMATPVATAERRAAPRQRPAAGPPKSQAAARAKADAAAMPFDEATAPWPDLSLEEVIAHDPFAVPAWIKPPPETPDLVETPDQKQQRQFAQQQQQEKAAALAKLRQQGTRIVVLTDGDKVARIGEHSVRIGDTIEGFRITDITTAGVVLSPEKSP